MENYHNLLIEATHKQISLNNEIEFQNEFLMKAPPVLWFGDNSNNKNKILTLGANPSREEFLSDNKNKTIERLKNGYKPRYLKGKDARFRYLEKEENWNDIIENKTLRNEIISSYNDYFKVNSYNKQNAYKWFGKENNGKELSYNVEGFVNCFNSSFFNGNKKNQSIHIDLFPFSTVSDFKSILTQSEKHIFKDNWTKEFLDKLILEINPVKIIVFGRTNFNYLTKLLKISDTGEEYFFNEITENGSNSNANYWCFDYMNITVIGLSVNLGNPKGFSKVTLKNFGNTINKFLKNTYTKH